MIEELKPLLWVKVEKPTFDLWGVITSSMTFAALAALTALLLGFLAALLLIWTRQRTRPACGTELALGAPHLPAAKLPVQP